MNSQVNNKITSELKEKYSAYLSDEMYIPVFYKGKIVEELFFSGNGNHSISELEAICNQFKEYCHMQTVIKQNCMKHIVELKFGVNLYNEL